MEDLLKKRESESDFEWKVRLCNAKLNKEIDLDWSEISEILGLGISSDHLRKLSYAYKEFSEHINNKIENNVTGVDEIINKLETKKLEFEKEKIKLQDQKREYRNLIKIDARFEHIRDCIKEEIKNLNIEKPLVNTHIHLIDFGNREASLLCSDWHTGLEVDNHWNKFNIEVLKQRVSMLVAKTVHRCKENRVGTLHMELLGDLLNGYIHLSTRVFNEEDVIKQTMICSEVLAEAINELSRNVGKIKVYNSIGNHGRCTANVKESLSTENFENLLPWYLKARLVNLHNVEFVENTFDEEIVVYDVFNEKIFSIHGHKDSPNNAISSLSKMLKVFPTRVHMGHFHRHFELEDAGIVVSVNGCLSGTDQYAKDKRLYSIPHQKLIIFDRYEGELCTYKIKF